MELSLRRLGFTFSTQRKRFLGKQILKLTDFQRIDWKKHSFIKQDSDESEDEDLYFRQKKENDSRKRPDQKPVQKVQVQQPEEIDTDDEINEVLDQKTKTDPTVTEKVEEDEEVERIIRDTPKNDTEPKKVIVTIIRVRFYHIVFSQ